jgi:hypothetical protein
MASTKISDLTELLGGSVAADDLATIVDVSDLTSGAGGTNKKMLLSQFGGRFLLDTQTVSAVSSIDFSSIPQMFNRLIIQGRLKCSVAAESGGCSVFFNGDTTATNYYTQYISAYNTTATVGEGADAVTGNVTGATGVGASVNIFELEDYAGGEIKVVSAINSLYRVGGSAMQLVQKVTFHDSMVAAITSLSLVPSSGTLTGTLRLYGEF